MSIRDGGIAAGRRDARQRWRESWSAELGQRLQLGACLSNRNGETKESKLPCAGKCLARMVLGRFRLFRKRGPI